MGLNILQLEPDPTQDISKPTELVLEFDIEPDPEMPENVVNFDDIDELDQCAVALEAIGSRIACEGMSIDAAREIDKYIPHYLRRAGGTTSFTHKPSLEGLSGGMDVVKKRLMEIIASVRKYVSDLFQRFKAWLLAKFNNPETQKVQEQVQAFVAKRNNREAMRFMADLPEEPEKAAYEVATYAKGDPKEFSTALTDQLSGMLKGISKIEEQLTNNPVQYRLATGVVTVQELFKEEADAAINAILKKAVAAADASMKTRNYEEFKQAVTSVDAVTAELTDFEKNMVINDTVSEEQGEGSNVRLDKLFDNINQVAEDMTRVDVQSKIKEMTGSLDDIIRISNETKIEEIIEMIPEDVPAEQQSVMAQKIASLYRRIAKLGADILKLWKTRSDSIATINTIGNALIALVTNFEKSIVSAGTSLTDEQKQEITKGLGAKGFTISFSISS